MDQLLHSVRDTADQEVAAQSWRLAAVKAFPFRAQLRCGQIVQGGES